MNGHLIDVVLIEYQKENERKAQLDSRTVGYVTIISILLASSIGITAYSLSILKSELNKVVSVFFLFGEGYFTLWGIGFSLIAHKMRVMANFKMSELKKLWGKKEDYIDGSIFRTGEKILLKNIEFNKRIEEYNSIIFSFLWISFMIFCLQFIWTIYTSIKGGI